MLTNKSVQDLATIARNGDGMVIDGSRYAVQDLATIARNMDKTGYLEITNSDRFSTQDLATIARNGDGSVVFS